MCAHTDCKKFVKVGQTQVTNTVYPVICHKHCTIQGLPTETINDPRLATCFAFKYKKNKFQDSCLGCHHSYKQHMHIQYTSKVVEKEFVSQLAQREINSKKDLKARKDAAVKELTKTIEELEEEKDYIMTCASSFLSFLKHNA